MKFLTTTLPPDSEGIVALSFPRAEGAEGPDDSEDPGILALLSMASRGDMKYGDPGCAPRRDAVLAAAGADSSRALGLRLAHSRTVLFPGDEDSAGADGIVLSDPSLVATVTVADCMPIWLLDRASGAFGVLHSGWKGTGILAAAVEGMARGRGSPASSISVILGPAIGSCCYEVPAERARSFAAEFGESAAFREGGAWRIDLRAANLGLARSLGVGALLSVEACTSCEARLGSYRRQGKDSFTRMLAACGRFPLVHPIAG